ncbi:hypothetical protein AGMMS50230_07340 [Spirochaetia bacterium]|nr:hypothetical protein AGMMS50230_07340 [Spirochaetia bacterium]
MKKTQRLFGIAVLLTAAMFTLTGCGNPSSWVAEYAIGDTGPGGGIIFYVSEAGFGPGNAWHYLEAAPADINPTKAWASSINIPPTEGGSGNWLSIPNTQTGIGSGYGNTAAIKVLDANAPAAQACDAYSNKGISDWFLPSIDELVLMYTNLKTKGLGNFQDDWYWSSSQEAADSAWGQRFLAGYKSHTGIKFNTHYVRAARGF